MSTATFATSARHPAAGVAVLVLGVATASWALVHASESSARAAWEVPHLTAPDGSPLVLAPMPPVLASDSLRTSLGWTLTVLAWVAVCWVATAHQARTGRPWLPVVVGAAALGAQCSLAFVPASPLVSPLSWPGPAQPIDWSVDGWALTLADPAALAPVVVLIALVGARWWALRAARESNDATRADRVSRPAARRALLAVGVPALALWLGAVAVLVGTEAYGWGTAEAALLPTAAVEPGGSLLLLVVAAALVSGAGRVGALALLAAQVATTAPIASMWSGGSSDLLLLACALSAGAMACAACWYPVARALADLSSDAPEITAAPSWTA
ncbi:hypothetical protein DDP54_15315 [Cellulomonas sp. WB94]|uniref:hypothetical protein n=1 Tax=Cellulomonas sp. WB94 TaxID=2173174 RepID=UPI000D566A93|nr:hypothetical protein [Cellulomonas sp. WB94]PVU81673.1 hypothetical protein DDP54_15315 [Cellulomonas sp. WB94]